MSVNLPPEVPHNSIAYPEGMPENYDELVAGFNLFVTKAVLRYNKVGRNFEDLLQEIWVKIFQAEMLEKFAKKYIEERLSHMPDEMTVEMACAFLGVTHGQWNGMMRAYSDIVPNPKSGTPAGLQSVYTMMDVVSIDEIARTHIKKRSHFSVLPDVDPVSVKKAFMGYLQRSVKNHFNNWCRTRSRKYSQERLLPNGAIMGEGHYKVLDRDQDMVSWEATIEDKNTIDPESMLIIEDDMNKALKRQGIQPDSDKEDEVFQALDDGYTLPEAIQRATGQTKAKVRAQLRQR